MALKILLADDSMTAQNMGKKILVDAGYEVIPVSNGAAAVKKIAEHRPDLVILDIYMPGYTGLEVCDRVKNAPETANMPVLLTVGKMEPYRADDGAKVKADGVIIKPFEASDLIAAVVKLEKLIAPKVAAPVYEDNFEEDQHWRTEPSGMVTDQPSTAFEVPEAMSSAPAMLAELSVEAPAEAPAAMAAAAIPVFGSAPEFQSPVSLAPELSAFDAVEASVPPAFGPFDTQMIEALDDSATPAYMDMYSVAQEPEEFHIAPAHIAAPETVVSEAVEESVSETSEADAASALQPETNFELEVNEPAPDVRVAVEVAPDLEFNSAPKAGEVEAITEAELEPATPPEEVAVAEEVHDPCLITDPAEVVNPFVGQANSDASALSSAPIPEETESSSVEVEATEPSTSRTDSPEVEPIVAETPSDSVPLPEVETPVVPAWQAEETVVLPAEASVLLEQEMQQSLEQEHPVAQDPEPVMEATLADENPEASALELSASPEELEKTSEETQAHEPALAEVESEPEPVVEHQEEPVGALSALDKLRAEIFAMESAVLPPAEAPGEELLSSTVPAEAEIVPASEPASAEVPEPEEVLTEEALPESVLLSEAPAETAEMISEPLVAEDPVPLALDQLESELPSPEPLELHPETDGASVPSTETLAMAAAAGSEAKPILGDSLIADVVQRVFDRHKEQMIAEIARELGESAKQ